MDLTNLTIKEAREKLDNKEIKVVDLVKASLEFVKDNNNLNIYREVFTDVMEQAKIAQNMIDTGKSQALTGIPFAIKDNILIKDKKSGASSKVLEGYIAPYSSTASKKLSDQGVVWIGRTNMDEFAMGSSTENSAYGPTKNPHDDSRVPGGSSGGSAVAVASGTVLGALGSDTGGSIRQPASFCGVVGLKPTYGSVSRYGLMAMASSLDVIGPFAKNVSDAEIIFNEIKGVDPMDATSQEDGTNKKPKTIGVPRNFIKEGIDKDVLENFEDSLKKLDKLGYEIKNIEIPALDYSLAIYYIIMPAEVSSNMARYDGIKYGNKIEGKDLIEDYFKTRGNLIGKEVRRRIMLGTYVLSAGYADEFYYKAVQVRELMRKDVNKAFNDVDIIAMPTSPVPAFKIGEKSSDPLSMYLADIFTVSANLAGIPAISIPSGTVLRDDKKLPVSIQFLARHFGEDQLFSVGKDFETSL